MTTPKNRMNAQYNLSTIIDDMIAAFVRWADGTIDTDEYGKKIAYIVCDLDDYRQAYAPTDREREAQDRDHAEELARDVFQDAQEDRL